jgi:hypothetical protein
MALLDVEYPQWLKIANKKTYWENNGQITKQVQIA